MTGRRVLWCAAAATLAAVTIVGMGSGAAHGQPGQPGQPTGGNPSSVAHHHPTPLSERLTRVLHPRKKYYGVYVSRAPSQLGPIRKVTKQIGKQPNLSLYYEDWGRSAAPGYSNFQTSAADNACREGMLPMLTWESWNASNMGPNGARVTQRAFAPRKIAKGKYDKYIRASARAMKAVKCPMAIRFDQEVNSNWYPWAINTPGMHNTAHAYVAMWRHVRRIFASVHANNIVWVWSPNVQSRKHHGLPSLAKSYPGKHYVDWIGIDGYFYHQPHATFHKVFGPTIKQLSRFAAKKPWIVAECGVGSGPHKAREITNLLAAVARSKRFDGINYFDSYKPWARSDWAFSQTRASLKAFRTGISRSVYGAGKPGRVPGT